MDLKKSKNIALILIGISVAISICQISARTYKERTTQGAFPLHSLSYQFLPLQPIFKNVPRAGYYTDKDLEIPLAVAQYEQAQYVLAPTVLEINNTNLPLVIFDCTSPKVAITKMQELNLTPISVSPQGLILAANPKAGS